MKKKKVTDKELVLKSYPNANCRRTKMGTYYIHDGDDSSIFEEYLLPETETEDKAWEQAVLTIKTTQHFNRTHPDRLNLEVDEQKTSRRAGRKRRSRKH